MYRSFKANLLRQQDQMRRLRVQSVSDASKAELVAGRAAIELSSPRSSGWWFAAEIPLGR